MSTEPQNLGAPLPFEAYPLGTHTLGVHTQDISPEIMASLEGLSVEERSKKIRELILNNTIKLHVQVDEHALYGITKPSGQANEDALYGIATPREQVSSDKDEVEDINPEDILNLQRTLILIKPDAVRAKTTGWILNDLQKKGFEIVEMKMEQKPLEFIEKHYEEHKGKSFFATNNEFVASGKLVALILQGHNVISAIRAELGAVGKGGLRGTYGSTVTMNAVHASDGEEAAAKEIEQWFGPEYVKVQ
jgi:nucleoside-diphosphate kinase